MAVESSPAESARPASRFGPLLAVGAAALVVANAVTVFPSPGPGLSLSVAGLVLYLALWRTRSSVVWGLLYTYALVGLVLALPWSTATDTAPARLAAFTVQVVVLLLPAVRRGVTSAPALTRTAPPRRGTA